MSKDKDKCTEIQLIYGMLLRNWGRIPFIWAIFYTSYSLRTILGWLKSCTGES